MNEIVTEVAACRTTYVRTEEENECFRQETDGYDEMTFVANVLATSFGIEEREFLRGGIQNREEFYHACKTYISDEDYQNDILSHFDKLESNLDLLNNALESKKHKPNDSKIIASSMKEICCQMYDIANIRVAKSTRKIDMEYAEELAYDFAKIRRIIADNIEYLERDERITEEMADQLLKEIISFEGSLDFLNKVSDILVLTNQKSQIKDQATYQEMEQLAKAGKLIEHAEMFGIEIEKGPSTRYKVISNHKKTNKEFENPTQWDNKEISGMMKKLWREKEVVDVRKEIIFETIGDFFSRFKNRKQKKLEVPSENGEDSFVEPKSDFDERCKVPPENLEPMKHSIKKEAIEKENGKE